MLNRKATISVFLLVAGYSCVLANPVSSGDAKCPLTCPELHAPVCASDDGKVYKEFKNPCELNASNCRSERSAVKHYKEVAMDWCTTTFVENLREKLNYVDFNKPECLIPCPITYAPVCVSNGKYRATLSNECEMGWYNCALGASKHFEVLKSSAC